MTEGLLYVSAMGGALPLPLWAPLWERGWLGLSLGREGFVPDVISNLYLVIPLALSFWLRNTPSGLGGHQHASSGNRGAIVVRGPRKGVGRPMEPHDFWNLAGRAGRWGNEFQGNIICVDPDDRAAWPEGVPLRKRYPIQRETDSIFGLGQGLLQFIETRWEREPNDLSKDSQLEQVCAYLLTAYLREGSISSLPFTKRHESALVGAANNALGVLALRIKVPASLAVRHSGVSAVNLQHLLTYFQQYEGDIEDLLPAPPESRDAYQRMSKIMAVVNTQA
jgi:hypothetical protein